MENSFDYIVIGSGFGGSTSALRLVEKGYAVGVLEQGREFKDDEFPKSNWNTKNYLWAPLLKCFGIQKITWFKKALVLSGTGVGGGSLVYANTLMTPPDVFFQNPIWPKGKDWKEELTPFYDKARFMLGVTENPWSHKADFLLRETAKDLGKEDTVENVKVGVYFGDPDKEKDPYFNGHGPGRKGCIACAGCMVGCRYNAKNTLVKNYLYFARKFGAKVFPLTKVVKIEFKEDEYYIHTIRTGAWFIKQRIVFKAKGIIVSGGVLGSMELLLKQKFHFKTLQNLSDRLGDNIRTNSEMLCGVTATSEKLNEGVAISSIMNPDDDTHVEIVKYPDGSSFMKLLTLPYVSYAKFPKRFFMSMIEILKNPFKFLKLYLFTDWAKNSIIFLVMQHLDSSLKMELKGFFFKRLSLSTKSGEKVPAYVPGGASVLEKFRDKVSGVAQTCFTEIMLDKPATAHILGGAPMGETKFDGVINEKFEVHGYPEFYIIDGSIVPCNIGVNPSLTITALAEYTMSHIQEKAGGTPQYLENLIKNSLN